MEGVHQFILEKLFGNLLVTCGVADLEYKQGGVAPAPLTPWFTTTPLSYFPLLLLSPQGCSPCSAFVAGFHRSIAPVPLSRPGVQALPGAGVQTSWQGTCVHCSLSNPLLCRSGFPWLITVAILHSDALAKCVKCYKRQSRRSLVTLSIT